MLRLFSSFPFFMETHQYSHKAGWERKGNRIDDLEYFTQVGEVVFSCGWRWHGRRRDQGRLVASILQPAGRMGTQPLLAFFLVGLPRWWGVSAKQHSWDTWAHRQGQGNIRTRRQSRGVDYSDWTAIANRLDLITTAQLLQMIWHHLADPTGKVNRGTWEEKDASASYGLEKSEAMSRQPS